MLYLKKLNAEDLEKEWQFVRDMPEDENGLTNSFHGVSREDFEHKAFPAMMNFMEGKNLPEASDQGIVVGCESGKFGTTAIVDISDVHALMIGAAGVGKTAYFLYPVGCFQYLFATFRRAGT